MKPYFLLLYNKIKLSCLKITHKNLITRGIQLFSLNTKFVFGKTATVEFDDRIISYGRLSVVVLDNAKLKIGKKVYMNENTMISCHSEVTIGDGCQFGPSVKVFDNNHRFDAEHGVKTECKSAPIRIGDHCWIGANSVILKGCEIGKNSVIGAGCVITENIPPCSIVTCGRELHIETMRK